MASNSNSATSLSSSSSSSSSSSLSSIVAPPSSNDGIVSALCKMINNHFLDQTEFIVTRCKGMQVKNQHGIFFNHFTIEKKIAGQYIATLQSINTKYHNLETRVYIYVKDEGVSKIDVEGKGMTLEEAVENVMKEIHRWKRCSNDSQHQACPNVGYLNSTIIYKDPGIGKDYDLSHYICVPCSIQRWTILKATDKIECAICTNEIYLKDSHHLTCCQQKICKKCNGKTRNRRSCPIHNCPNYQDHLPENNNDDDIHDTSDDVDEDYP